ncbi:hypothetical protein [Paracoccus sp. J56]|uniref:hypothetical protein n=1 Tax=Paracoccus sp. J56 TaxID=935850 RepID=UPI000A1CB6FE|nr:hypothetical protein [Paracoccus sp. J56]
MMTSRKTWDDIIGSFQVLRKATDELWKIWRWLGVGLLGLLAYERTGEISTVVFGVMMSAIGVFGAFGWLMEWSILSLTDKGRNSGFLISALLFLLFITICGFFAVMAWVYMTLLALPVFRVRTH